MTTSKSFCVLSYVLLIILLACNSNKVDIDYERVVLSDINKIQHDTLSIKKIPLDIDSVLTNKILMINDSIVANIKSSKAGNFLDVVDLKNGNLLSSYFTYGEGPSEILFCHVHSDGHDIIFTDYIRNRFTQFSLDSLSNNSFQPEFTSFPYDIGITSAPLKVKDSMIIVNPFRYINEKYDIKQDEPRFYHIAVNQKIVGSIKNDKLFTQNVGQVKLIRNKDSGDIWSISSEKSEIEVYDSLLNHKKTILIPSEVSDDADVIIEETSTVKQVIYVNHYPVSFTDATVSSDNKKIYLCLVGKLIEDGDRVEDNGVHILVLNWLGELERVFYVPNYIFSLSVLDSGLYATVENSEEDRMLVKLIYE